MRSAAWCGSRRVTTRRISRRAMRRRQKAVAPQRLPRRPWPRWMPIAIALLIVLAAPSAPPSAAQLVSEFYQATVIVTGTDMRSRPFGFGQALRAVLVNVSGEPRLRDDPRVSAVAAHADAFVASFSYVDRMAGRPVHDEQGTRDRPYNLTVTFVPAQIDKALADLGQQPWRGARPVVVPVLAVRIGTASYLMSDENPAAAEQRAAFVDVARAFDMNVRFPTEADFAAWGISPGRFPSLRPTAVMDDALVTGTLEFKESLPGWVGTWQWRWRGVDYAWGIQGVSFDEAFRDIVRGVLRAASGHGPPD
jgi:uncharacterized protein